MKRLLVGLMMLQPVVMLAEKPNPNDFTVKIHVVSSYSVLGGAGENKYTYQIIDAVIDNQPVQLSGFSNGVLAPGDYSARISKSVHGPKNSNTYDVYRGYDFLMPDGKVRTYTVTRLGPPVGTNP